MRLYNKGSVFIVIDTRHCSLGEDYLMLACLNRKKYGNKIFYVMRIVRGEKNLNSLEWSIGAQENSYPEKLKFSHNKIKQLIDDKKIRLATDFEAAKVFYQEL